MELEELKAEIEDLHTKRQFSAIKTILNQLNPADIAQLLEEFSNEERLLFFRLLGKEEAADTFVELEPDNQEALIHAFSDNAFCATRMWKPALPSTPCCATRRTAPVLS